MHNLIRRTEQVMQQHDRQLIERRDKQQASIAAAQSVLKEWTRWQRGDRGPLTIEEASQLIFQEFENLK